MSKTEGNEDESSENSAYDYRLASAAAEPASNRGEDVRGRGFVVEVSEESSSSRWSKALTRGYGSRSLGEACARGSGEENLPDR